MELALVFLVGTVSGFLGGIISGGFSILVFSLLSILGYPALIILGLLRLGLLGSNIGGLMVYHNAKMIVWKYVPLMSVIGAVGAYVGVRLIIELDARIIEQIVAIGIIIGLLFVLAKPQLGVMSFVPSKSRIFFSYIAYFFVVVWSTSITIGVGLFNMLVQTLGLGMNMLEMKATMKIPALIIGVIALAVYLQAGLIDWPTGLSLMLGTLVGSNLGARGSMRLGNKWLKYLFVALMLGFAIKLMFGL
jgi:uncharacterized membrane protein YfcA